MTYSGILCGALAPELQHATVKYFSPNFLEQKVFHVKKGDKYSVFQAMNIHSSKLINASTVPKV